MSRPYLLYQRFENVTVRKLRQTTDMRGRVLMYLLLSLA